MKDNFSYEFPTSLFWRIENSGFSKFGYRSAVSVHSHFPLASDHTQRPARPPDSAQLAPMAEFMVWADVLTSNLKRYFQGLGIKRPQGCP